jgi:hypothetical protein
MPMAKVTHVWFLTDEQAAYDAFGLRCPDRRRG